MNRSSIPSLCGRGSDLNFDTRVKERNQTLDKSDPTSTPTPFSSALTTASTSDRVTQMSGEEIQIALQDATTMLRGDPAHILPIALGYS
jgi:hypothetical protein